MKKAIVLFAAAALAAAESFAFSRMDVGAGKATWLYEVAISKTAAADPAWLSVANALAAKYSKPPFKSSIAVISDFKDAALRLGKDSPRYVAFVLKPEEAGAKTVFALHALMKSLDGDPYYDAVWGIVTGPTANDAMRVAKASPVHPRRALGTTGFDMRPFDAATIVSDGYAPGSKKEDYGSYDLKTLVEKEANYTKNVKWFSIGSAIFIIAFFLLMFVGRARIELYIFLILNLVILIPVLIRWLVIKYKYNGKAIDPATGNPRKLGGKWTSIIGYTLFGLAACLFLVAGVMSVIDSVALGWLALLKVLIYVSFFLAVVVLFLGIFHGKGKINVSYRLLVVLASLYVSRHLEHHCHGEHCHVCHHIHRCLELVLGTGKTVGSGIHGELVPVNGIGQSQGQRGGGDGGLPVYREKIQGKIIHCLVVVPIAYHIITDGIGMDSQKDRIGITDTDLHFITAPCYIFARISCGQSCDTGTFCAWCVQTHAICHQLLPLPASFSDLPGYSIFTRI